jgi:hypothetical protein
MARGINEIKIIGNAILSLVIEHDALGLDGNSPFPFDIQGVKNLLLHFPVRQSTAQLNKAIRYGGFAMINMGNDREIAYVF